MSETFKITDDDDLTKFHNKLSKKKEVVVLPKIENIYAYLKEEHINSIIIRNNNYLVFQFRNCIKARQFIEHLVQFQVSIQKLTDEIVIVTWL